MKKVLLLLLIFISFKSFSQIMVPNVGEKWKDKVDSAILVIEKQDSIKYRLLLDVCKQVDFWNGSFSSTTNDQTIVIPTSELRCGYVNDIAAILIHESLHLYIRQSKYNLTVAEEEYYCYVYELNFLYHIPYVESWLISNATKQVDNYKKMLEMSVY